MLENNDVLKILQMIKDNPELVHDVNHERKIGLHIACKYDYENLI